MTKKVREPEKVDKRDYPQLIFKAWLRLSHIFLATPCERSSVFSFVFVLHTIIIKGAIEIVGKDYK
jgi:hypothetical protein